MIGKFIEPTFNLPEHLQEKRKKQFLIFIHFAA